MPEFGKYKTNYFASFSRNPNPSFCFTSSRIIRNSFLFMLNSSFTQRILKALCTSDGKSRIRIFMLYMLSINRKKVNVRIGVFHSFRAVFTLYVVHLVRMLLIRARNRQPDLPLKNGFFPSVILFLISC